MGADRNQWQFPKNVAGNLLGWRDDGKGMENKPVGETGGDIISAGTAADVREILDVPWLSDTAEQPFSGPISAPYILNTYRGLRISEFLTSNTVDTGNQSAEVTEAVTALFDGNYINLDFEGKLVPITSKLSFICGVNGFTVSPNILKNRANGLINGGLVWKGADDPGEFIFEIGCPTSITPSAAFQDLYFHRFVFDSQRKSIGSIKPYNFYNAIFSNVIFRDFNNEVSVFARSADNSDVYVDDNGLSFYACRWACLPTENNLTGTPVKAYCGDIVVEGGYSEWCGPHDYHIGSIFMKDHHWSFASGTPTEMRVGAIFRDPREIVIQGCDLDNTRFKLTNVGWMAGESFTNGPTQLAGTNFRNINISGNELSSDHVPSGGEGWVTFETQNASTNIYAATVEGNILEVLGHGDDAVPEVVYKTTGSGTFNTIDINRGFTNGFGLSAGDGEVIGAPTTNGSSNLRENGFSRKQVRSATANSTSIDRWYRGTSLVAALYADGSFETSASFKFIGSTAYIKEDGSNGIYIGGGGVDRWDFVSNGVLRPVTDNSYNLGSATNRVSNGFITNLRPGAGTATWTSGAGTPEGSVTATVGSLYTRTDGAAATTLYVKESGAGNTGWVAK